MANEIGLPIAVPEGLLFAFKDVSYSPVAPRMDEPFTVKGKVNLLKIPFFGPVWVIATVTYPETWWEEIIPIWGSPEVRATDVAIGGNFEITFANGFQREGEFSLSVRVYPGPTIPIDSIVLPPAPAAATVETTFLVAGEAPPQEELFRDFRIASYSKNGGDPVTPPGVLELDVGDRCRVNLVYNHKGPAVTGKFHAAIWHRGLIDPHDEILFTEQSFSVPQTADWEPFEKSIDIIITSAISPGSDYGLYCKIMGITGADVFTEFLEDVITITGVPVGGEFRNFGIAGWTPDPAVLSIGDSLIITHHFEYKGPRYTTADIHSAIGTRGWAGFDEILAKSINIEAFGPNEDWVGYDVEVTIPITTAISPGVDYDLYSKLTDIPGADLYDYKEDIIEIVGVEEPQLSNLQIINYDSPVDVGGSCQVQVRFTYQGPAVSKTLRAAIGNYGWAGFDEILYGSKTINIPESQTPMEYENNVSIPITSAIDPAGSPYDLYAKVDGVISPVLQSVITVAGPPITPEFRNLRITSYDSPLEIGDKCRVMVEFDYQGPSVSKSLYAAIGNSGWAVFDEILHGSRTISIPETDSWQTYNGYVDISITSAIDPAGSPYDLYAKIDGVTPDIISPVLESVINITVGVPSQDVRNLQIIDYDRKVDMGDYCAVTVEFEYIGKACSGTLRAALGNVGAFGFDEVKYDQGYVSIPQSMTWTKYSFNLSIPTSGMSAGFYDLYAKIGGGAPSLIGPFLYDVVEVVAAVPNPEIRNFKISSYDSQVQTGDYCQVKCSFEYQGPANSGTLRAALGNAGAFGFDEIVYDTESIYVPETSSWRTYTATARIYISTAISAGVYDIYAKITGALPDVFTPTKYNVVTVKAPVDFYVYVTNLPSGWTDATHWAAYYYDPGTGSWIGSDVGVGISSAIRFDNVMPGGSINASLWHPDKGWSYSRTSPIFNPEQGERYDFRFSTNTIVPH